MWSLDIYDGFEISKRFQLRTYLNIEDLACTLLTETVQIIYSTLGLHNIFYLQPGYLYRYEYYIILGWSNSLQDNAYTEAKIISYKTITYAHSQNGTRNCITINPIQLKKQVRQRLKTATR